ncbi:YgjP-like metallopeptidase domain-containing protein [Neolewinella sp.]|uniref:YgjP-like metallopeptidase domain-containing protein n=1 Tax=Neolewinella sp. TaxID=2993543 RepID=UPI003B52CDB3
MHEKWKVYHEKYDGNEARPFYSGPVALRIKWLINRWGSCRRSGTITLNYELIKAPRNASST